MHPLRPNGVIGSPVWRIDGPAKVTGGAPYGADHRPGPTAGRLLYAALHTSAIARGRVKDIDDSAARSVAGVCEILTFRNVGKAVKPGKPLLDGGYMASAVAPLRSDKIFFAGQIVAVVIAETPEIAQAAADSLRVTYKAKRASASLDSPGAETVKAKALGETELKAGDLEKGFAQATATVDAWYETPAQHHNPMELFQTTCAWCKDNGGKEELVIWESTQNVRGSQYGVAKQLGLKPAQVRFISTFIGGAFGSRGELGQVTALIAFAARQLGRPVKFVATRREGFTQRTFRAETRHHVRLGADAEGHLTALAHDGWELTSRSERFALAGIDATARLYACPNVHASVRNVKADRQAPGFMRAPPEVPYLFALESAMDELSYTLGLDPLELRRTNDTLVETVTGKPYTSRSLIACIDHGAELFGWSRRTPEPRSLATPTHLVGWGFATAFYPTQVAPAECRLTLTPELTALVETGTHEIGTGIRTVIAQVASDLLGVALGAVEVRIGDSALPAAPMAAGSNSTASVGSAVATACEQLRVRLAKAAVADESSPFHGLDEFAVRLRAGEAFAHRDGQPDLIEPLALTLRRINRGRPVVEKGVYNPPGAPPLIGPALIHRGIPLFTGGERSNHRMQFAFGAQFVEVTIDRATGELRVPRAVGVFTGGRIMNRRTATAQLSGGQVWGISSALHESTELDPTLARYVNSDLSEYHVPVCADVHDITTVILDEVDTVINPLGIKGVGELGVTGLNAAIANAVFHASGERLRKLPIRVGDLPWSALA